MGRSFYVNLVNTAYSLSGGNEMPAIKVAGTPERVVQETEAHFRTLSAGVPNYDHYAPARYLIEHAPTFEAVEGGALDRFEKLFVDLNALL